MRHAEDITDLFARYAAEVGRHLPWRGRDDIEREIAATLADRLDDRMAGSGREATAEDAAALLKETGHPRKAAVSYLADTHLVGPALYPMFLLVCRVALPVLAAVLIGVLTLSAALGADPSTGFFEHLVRILGSAAGGVLQAFALIVIVFAVMERVDARKASAAGLPADGAWDPRTLPRVQPGSKIKISDQVAAIVGNTIVLAAVVLLPRFAVRNPSIAGRAVVVAILSEGFLRLLPVVMGVAIAQIVAAVFLLTRRSHTAATIAVSTAVKVLSIAAAGIYLTVYPYVLAGPGLPAGAELGIEVVNKVIRAGCVLGIVFGSVEVATLLVRYFRRPVSVA
ncbi:MAG: hypothetical protein NTU62_16125 [Spirochaetes bacterium]|nr:hypothetical protein [Spirochaetota bacterium]